MDFSTLSNDELAQATRDLLDELHGRHEALPESAFRRGVGRRLGTVHGTLDVLREYLVDGGVIQPTSGGIPKPEGGG